MKTFSLPTGFRIWFPFVLHGVGVPVYRTERGTGGAQKYYDRGSHSALLLFGFTEKGKS